MTEGRLKRAIDLKERVPELTGELRTKYAEMDVSWTRCGYAKAAREALVSFGLGPMIDHYVANRTVGREIFESLRHPVIFVANHSSHLDTPTILRAMPRKWRRRTAVAAAADYFYDSRWKARGVALLFNTVPIGRRGGGLSNGATDHVDRIIDEGWNLVMFPEGTRSRDGAVGKVRSGAAVIAAAHGLDVVPIFIAGTHEAMPPGQNWPQRIPTRRWSRRHEVEVRFGRPIRAADAESPQAVMEEVRAFWARKGRPERPKLSVIESPRVPAEERPATVA